MLRTLAAASVCAIAACGTPPPPSPPAPVVGQEPLRIGPAAQDTVGGWLPDGRTVSPFDAEHPIVKWLDPALREAVQKAARSAEDDGIKMRITSGWRSKGFQERLFDDGVVRYGSVQAAREFVASPEKSKHVTGEAVDIGPVEADKWLIANGRRFGLCQIYANEIWHFELAVVDGRCPPLKPNAAAD
ncbi:peptidase M15 [Mycolicibacterium acapulense]|nr:peptidase M15 [Mycolicibacterium acapulense]